MVRTAGSCGLRDRTWICPGWILRRRIRTVSLAVSLVQGMDDTPDKRTDSSNGLAIRMVSSTAGPIKMCYPSSTNGTTEVCNLHTTLYNAEVPPCDAQASQPSFVCKYSASSMYPQCSRSGVDKLDNVLVEDITKVAPKLGRGHASRLRHCLPISFARVGSHSLPNSRPLRVRHTADLCGLA